MNQRNHLFLASGLLILLGVLGGIMQSQIPPRVDLPFDLTSTTLAAEFASTPIEINEVIASDRRYASAIAREQYWDFGFIAGYVALFVLLGLALRSYDIPGAVVVAWIAVLCAVAAGVCDVAENVTILKTMATPTALSSHVRWFSLPKWILIFFVMALESALFFSWPGLRLWWRLTAGVVGALFLFAGASGLLFSFLVSIPDMAWSAAWMKWAFLGALLFFVSRALIPGSSVRARRLRY